jgi:hypothetical protein
LRFADIPAGGGNLQDPRDLCPQGKEEKKTRKVIMSGKVRTFAA